MNEISRLTPFPTQPDLAVREMPLYVFGHKNPDSDSICSALVVADWLNHLGKPAVAFRLGDLTPETRYILAAAGVQAPALLKGDLRDRKVWLVDFTDVEQGPASLPDSDVVGVIDHHRLGTLVTRNPPDVWVRAVGCCATVILQILTAEKPMPLNAAQATLLLSQIEVRAMRDIDPLLPALQQALEQAKQEAGLEMTALLVTDITRRRSTLYFSSNRVLDIRQVSLPDMTSRKKRFYRG